MSQSESREKNLDYIIECLLKDCQTYVLDENVLKDIEKKAALMRALENIREPIPTTNEFIEAEAKELSFQLQAKGVVYPKDLDEGSIVVWRGDITRLAVDAIVNACNGRLLGCWRPGHMCIDNVIHSAAGIRLRLACYDIMKSLFENGQLEETGRARITPGFCLPCKHVLHTVGPIIKKGCNPTKEEDDLLASCYRSCLECAEENRLESVAFCCISTGEFHFPKRRAAEIAVRTVREFMDGKPQFLEKVIFNTFKELDDEIYHDLLDPKADKDDEECEEESCGSEDYYEKEEEKKKEAKGGEANE